MGTPSHIYKLWTVCLTPVCSFSKERLLRISDALDLDPEDIVYEPLDASMFPKKIPVRRSQKEKLHLSKELTDEQKM
jgi:hypothetical protein